MVRPEAGAGSARDAGGWIDVSRPLHDQTPVWPGDREFVLTQVREPEGVLSSFESTCHAGTHVDAPLHLDPSAGGVVDIPLGNLIGPADVVRVAGVGRVVAPEDLPKGWAPTTCRVLLRTDSHALHDPVGPGFSSLSADLVCWLADRGVILVGLDTPSVDCFESSELLAHKALLARGMTWIEGLWLENVDPGRFVLVALPLRLEGAEASPVRAILRPLASGSAGIL